MPGTEPLLEARRGTAVGPAESPAILRLGGRDARSFLHRMSTQDLAALRPGASAYTAFLDARGHLLSDALVQQREDDLLLVAPPEVEGSLAAHLRKYVIMDKVTIEALSPGLRALPVLGEEGVARQRAAPTFATVEDPRRGAPALDLLVPAEEAPARREALLREGAADLSAADLEALRVLAGIPRFGADMDGSRLVMEAALSRSAVSFQKGCYIGQEVVLRGTFRGRIQKGLVQLSLPGGAGPGARLLAGGQEVGVVTSAVATPEGRLGLGYLRRAHWHPGARRWCAGCWSRSGRRAEPPGRRPGAPASPRPPG
jgi:tRNA-modifying protein YgfZ